MDRAAALGAEHRIAVYGTLAPGRSNHAQLSGLRGRWIHGTVRGRLWPEGWGAALGYPGIELDPGGPLVDVHLFESGELPNHWSRLDEFEGPGYRRVIASVATEEGELPSYIYELSRL